MDSVSAEMARSHFENSIAVKREFLDDPSQLAKLIEAAEICVACYRSGGKILVAGNGGSAADAQHFAGELVSRFNFDRPPLPAIAITTDTSIMTAIGNDYGYELLFSRQVDGLGVKGDVLIAISTSGKSANIISAVKAANAKGMTVVGLTGKDRDFSGLCDIVIAVPSSHTPVIQECHETILHILCSIIECQIFGSRRVE